MKKINIIATTISGSIKDWQKIPRMESEFKKYTPSPIKLYTVDSHKQARKTANKLIKKGERTIVSAGGAGTFNSVLQGSRLKSGFPKDLRLAFLRKGSADLIGKVLKISDNLNIAAKQIAEGIKKDKTIESDVIEVLINNKKYHFIGFGGAGVFGIIPYFTESRFIKYYKGILSYLFGDRGPFLVGINLAVMKFYKDKLFKDQTLTLKIDNKIVKEEEYNGIVIMNGDLTKDFPLAKGMPLSTGKFKLVLFKNRGIIKSYKQLKHAWKGDLEKYKNQLGIEVFYAKTLKISSPSRTKFMFNLDGLLIETKGPISLYKSDKIKLISG